MNIVVIGGSGLIGKQLTNLLRQTGHTVTAASPSSGVNAVTGEGLSETAVREGYTRFKREKDSAELAAIAAQHQLAPAALQTFVDGILQRMIFDGEHLSDLMAPLDLGWKARAQAELALMKELVPLLQKRAQGRDISGLSAYE